jgi:hypothetical protein
MVTGVAASLMLDLAATHIEDQHRAARLRADAAHARGTRAPRGIRFRNR